MAGKFEKFEVQDSSERDFIESEAKVVAAEMIKRVKDGGPYSRPEVVAWGRFSAHEQGLEDPRPGTTFLADEIGKTVRQMAEGDPELKEALKFGEPGYAIGKRPEMPPDFNPLKIEE